MAGKEERPVKGQTVKIDCQGATRYVIVEYAEVDYARGGVVDEIRGRDGRGDPVTWKRFIDGGSFMITDFGFNHEPPVRHG